MEQSAIMADGGFSIQSLETLLGLTPTTSPASSFAASSSSPEEYDGSNDKDVTVCCHQCSMVVGIVLGSCHMPLSEVLCGRCFAQSSTALLLLPSFPAMPSPPHEHDSSLPTATTEAAAATAITTTNIVSAINNVLANTNTNSTCTDIVANAVARNRRHAILHRRLHPRGNRGGSKRGPEASVQYAAFQSILPAPDMVKTDAYLVFFMEHALEGRYTRDFAVSAGKRLAVLTPEEVRCLPSFARYHGMKPNTLAASFPRSFLSPASCLQSGTATTTSAPDGDNDDDDDSGHSGVNVAGKDLVINLLKGRRIAKDCEFRYFCRHGCLRA